MWRWFKIRLGKRASIRSRRLGRRKRQAGLKIQINKLTFQRLWRLGAPFFFSEFKWKARGLVLLLAVFALSIAGINVLLSYAARDFMTAFSLKDEEEFFKTLVLYLLMFTLATPVTVFQSYCEQRLALLWRMWLSRQVLQKYFSHMAYYKVRAYEGIDNPDQRIEEDIRNFTSTTLSLFIILCNALLTLVLFLRILWSISFNLIIAVVLYALFGTMITYLIGRSLIGLNFSQLKKEANYRYKLVNIRDNAESIAFYRGDKKELTRARQRLKKALDNFLRIVNLSRNIGFFVTGYNNLKPVIPIIVVAPLYLSGKIAFGVVTQSADAFIRVVEALSVMIQHFATISSVTAVVTRLGSFSEALDDIAAQEKAAVSDIEIVEEPRLAFDRVTILTPKRDQTLLRELSFSCGEGGLLITGTSGSGKTSILRAIAGLWSAGSGKIVRPPLVQMMFIPQRPYMILGTLSNQLLYTSSRQGVPEEELRFILKQVGLEDTLARIKGFEEIQDWNSILSTGEQQRLAFARLLLARPQFAFLDEATTAVDSVSERHLYSLLIKSTQAFVSVGYRTNLAKYHHTILELQGGRQVED